MSGTVSDAIGRLVAAPDLVELAHSLEKSRSASASGLWGSSVAAVVATLRAQIGQPIVLICGHIDEADDLADDIELFTKSRPEVLPALELAGSLGRVSEEQVSNRLRLISKLANDVPRSTTVITPIQSIMQSVPAKSQLAQLMLTLKPGQAMEAEKLIVWLADHGYNRLDQVEVPGDFAVRGGIIDVYLPGEFEQDTSKKSDDPSTSSGQASSEQAGSEREQQIGLTARIDFFGDQIESIKRFDLDSLGSQSNLDSVRLVDLKGQLPETGESTNLFSYMPPETIVVLWAPLEIAEQAKSYLDRLPDVKGVYPLQAILHHTASFARLELSQFDQGTSAGPSFVGAKDAPHVRLPIGSLQKFETEAKKAIAELAEFATTHEVTVFCENDGERKRFIELLDQDQPGLRENIGIETGYLHRGFVFSPSPLAGEGRGEGSARHTSGDRERHNDRTVTPHPSPLPQGERGQNKKPIAVLGHHELFHRYEQRRKVRKVIAARPVDSFLDLKIGDYVVHVAHGIAKFTGMQTIVKDGQSEEYLTLRFAENAALHVPAARINLIQKYIGGFHGHPQLSRLGSGVWEKQKAKVSEAVMDMAAELLEIQASRAAELGTPYPPDTQWQKEFEAEFPYQPTNDQVTAAEEIKQDMQKARPMDRLLCGDVGYGKTEMAMRAAFKAIEYGKQVGVLVPTTVLAEQHYRSFKERMADYPFEIASISRFKTAKEQKETIKKLATGEIDILIGTHRLISKDVKFNDLGLVVIDEEQRFGVTHKERLKQMRRTVDVLTMSATPIPRTLHMSMLGLRDISSLTTAPQDRRSIVTEVVAYDKNRIKMAILRELNRGGQVYFVHNRVHSIQEQADEILKLVPDARIIIGHGQMGEGELEDVMVKFINHEADILVCTTIIESGLDIPNTNTIIINNADRFGLSELHQLRGRVGRWKHRAYCYLLLPPDRPVTPVAAKRLKAIEEYSHLGAGFKIAMRDLEIRGAGNILGPEQSGHIAVVGYEMYCQLLEEATRQIKKEPKETTPEAHVDIGVSAFIPKPFIPGDRQRLDVYRRLTRCTSLDMLQMLEQDIKDAFGEPPRPMVLLFALTEVRLLAVIYGIESIIRKEPDVVLTVRDAAKAQVALTGAPGTLRVIDEKTVYLRMPPSFLESDTLLMVLKNLMRGAYDRAKNPTEKDTASERPKEPEPKKSDAQLRAESASSQRSQSASKKPVAKPSTSLPSKEVDKLISLRDQGILTQEEFQAAVGRLAAKR